MKRHALAFVVVGLVGTSACATEAEDATEVSDQSLSAPCGGQYTVQGLIEEKYNALGGRRSFLGCPTSSETPTPDKRGAFNTFQGGSIYWSPETGAREVHGAIRDAWGRSGWENGPLDFPTTDESTGRCLGVRYSGFQNGAVVWTPLIGARTSFGPVREVWERQGFECGRLGVPWSDVYYSKEPRRIQINALQSYETSGEAFWQIYTQPNGRTAAIISQNVQGRWASVCSLGLLAWFPC